MLTAVVIIISILIVALCGWCYLIFQWFSSLRDDQNGLAKRLDFQSNIFMTEIGTVRGCLRLLEGSLDCLESRVLKIERALNMEITEKPKPVSLKKSSVLKKKKKR